MAVHTVKTNLKGLKKWAWRKNLSGFFSFEGRMLSDKEVRAVVEYAISKGYEYDCDIPNEEVREVLKLKSKDYEEDNYLRMQ